MWWKSILYYCIKRNYRRYNRWRLKYKTNINLNRIATFLLGYHSFLETTQTHICYYLQGSIQSTTTLSCGTIANNIRYLNHITTHLYQ